MGSEITAGDTAAEAAVEAASIFEKIAQSLGLPPMVVEISFIILTMIIILIVFVFLFTALRIRKEMIRYLEPGIQIDFERSEVIERSKSGKLKQFSSYINTAS